MKVKRVIAAACSKIVNRAALRSANVISERGFYQPKEPKVLAEIRKQK